MKKYVEKVAKEFGLKVRDRQNGYVEFYKVSQSNPYEQESIAYIIPTNEYDVRKELQEEINLYNESNDELDIKEKKNKDEELEKWQFEKFDDTQKELLLWLKRHGNDAVRKNMYFFVADIYENYSHGDNIELKRNESKDKQIHIFEL